MKFKIIAVILIIAILGVGAYFLLIHTDNFNSELKTFYVKYEDRHLSTESEAVYLNGSTQRFDVVYTFDFLSKEQKGYSVKIVPNTKNDAEFTVNDRYYLLSAVSDLTAAFDITLEDGYFTLDIPKVFNIKTVLERLYEGSAVEVDERYVKSDEAFYTLIISSSGGDYKVFVDFGIADGKVKGVSLDYTRIEF